jgi:hypothetical protein
MGALDPLGENPMGLTVRKLQRLTNKGFPGLYESHQDEWNSLLNNATQFLDRTLPNDARILPDDVQRALSEVVSVNPRFRRFADQNNLTQLYWADDFTDYVIDRRYAGQAIAREAPPAPQPQPRRGRQR